MARNRTPFNSSTVGPIAGDAYMDNLKDRFKDLWDFSNIQLGTIAGTGNAITAVSDPALTAGITAGMKFSFIAANSNTGATTIAINGGSAVSIRDSAGTALAVGSIVAGSLYMIEFDGTNFRTVGGSSGSGGINNYQAFTASGTWNKPAGTPGDAMVTIHVWAGGGGGGSGTSGAVSGGGGGGWVEYKCRASDLASSVAVTIGAGGAIGGAGGTSSFGSLVVAYGGGPGASNNGGTNRAAGGGGGGGGTGAGGAGTSQSLAGGGSTPSAAGGSNSDPTAGSGSNANVTAANNGVSANANAGHQGGGGGGGCGNGSATTVGALGGPSVWGGAGGSGRTNAVGATSQFGGNGGASGAAGAAPGGGGGSNAVGARGEVHVFVNG